MLKETKRLLAVLLAVAFAITTFGSDFSFARVFAADNEVVQEADAEDPIETVEWETVQNDEENKEVADEGDSEAGSDSNETEKTEVAIDDAASSQAQDQESEAEKEEASVGDTVSEDAASGVNTVETSVESSSNDAVTEASSESASIEESSESASLSSSAEAATAASSDAASTEASVKKISSPAQDFSGDSVGIHVEVQAEEGVFPAGTTMVVNAISDLVAIDTAKEALGDNVQQAKGVDITFYNADGQEIEPSDSKYVHVSISLSSELSGETFSVLHKDDAGNTEKVANANSDGASFNANAFSVYIVAGEGDSSHDTEDQRAICTFTFYVDTTEFNTQLVKEGDTLAHPGIPSGLGSDDEFLGWFTSDGQEVKFGKVEHVTADSKVDVYAKIQTTYYLTYIGVDGEVVHVKKKVFVTGESTMVDVNDITTKPKNDTQSFYGWSLKKNSKDIITGQVDIAKVHEVFAVATDVHWIYFDENDGVQGGGATYTGPIHVNTGSKVKDEDKPAEPTRHGYKFGGWYEKKGANPGEVVESSAFNWDKVFTDDDEDITLYAKWIPNEYAQYTIVIWKQNIEDSKDITDNKQKTYDYKETHTATAKVGTTVSKELAGDYAKITEEGFHYSWVEGVRLENGNPVKEEKIRAEEDTIINVYYDRDLMTIKFMKSLTKSYNNLVFTGLYEQRLSKYGYNWPEEAGPWAFVPELLDTELKYLNLDFLDSFIFTTYCTGTTLLVYKYKPTGVNTDYYFYYQELDGTTYTLDHTISHYGTEGNRFEFFCDDYYNGFKPEYYIQNGVKHDMVSGQKITGNYAEDDSDDIHLYFKRLTSKIEFKDNFMGNTSLVEADPIFDSIPYEMPLDGSYNNVDYKGLAPDLSTDHAYDKPGYKFVGWYEDESGQKEYKWNDKMPLANKVLYAKYEKITCHVILDPNGGQIIGTQKAEFDVPYRTKLVKSSLIDCVRYSGYEFVGWFEDTAGNNPYGYGEVLTDIKLTAMWRRPGNVRVMYVAGEHGKRVPEDNYIYAVGSSAVVGAPPKEVDKDYVFIGWTIDNDKTNILYYPNNYFGIKEEYLSDTVTRGSESVKYIVLRANYNTREGSGIDPVYTTITYHSNDPRNLSKDVIIGPNGVDKLRVNEAVVALTLSEAGFERPGYTFLGWSKVPGNNRGKKFVDPGRKIAADNDGTPNDLYAIWVASGDNPPPPDEPDPPVVIPTPPDPPTTVTTVTPAPAGQVLGARRETGNGQAVLGARRGRTEDTTNLALRVLAIVAAGAVAAGLLITSRKKDDEQKEE
ncbi:InlB B-repeat-containing protein [Butyrivibrio proteoclasticus]|uniref:InlB B-repeat-containing protein n=1 Tax=Butyrivibrio proteoclasticus TaxID=43305 RepID=UPI00047D2241|nr:InlB B-repeat-containing protein [Butyrivibrio proteoclasticus]